MLIIGLGNPTAAYKNTPHNMGFTAVEALAKRMNKRLIRAECKSVTAVKSVNGEKIILAKPLTYMNLSGLAVKELAAKYKQSLDDIIVIYDDADLPRFSVRVRANGGAGTHNGMKSIVENLSSENFKRIRIGIGATQDDLAHYVLSRLSPGELSAYEKAVDQLAVLLEQYISDKDFDKLMRMGNVIK